MRTSVWLFVVLVAALAWLSIGVFPLASIEGDGTGIAQGAHHLAEHGLSALEQTYRYEMQAGTYAPLVGADRLFGWDTFRLFSLLSAVSALALVLLSARWISRRTQLPLAACGLLMLLVEETWVSAFYPNSNVVAAAMMMLAWNFWSDARGMRSVLAGGVLFGLACWIRFDVILLAPAVPWVLPRDTWRVITKRTLVAAVAACLTALVAFWLSGARLGAIAGFYIHHEEQVGSWGLVMKSCLAMFSLVTVLLAVLGILRTAKNDRQELVLVAVATVPLVLLLRSSLTTPKYLLYLAPLAGMLMAQGVLLLQSLRGWAKGVLITVAAGLFVVQYLLGLQIEYTDGYHPQAYPTVLRLAELPLKAGSIRRVSLVLGAGATMSTHDSIRLSSGIGFANGSWRHYKQQTARVIDSIASYVQGSRASVIGIYVEEAWEVRQLVEQALIGKGYRLVDTPDDALLSIWRKDDHEVRLFCGARGLQQARALAGTSPILAAIMWNDRLPRDVTAQFASARRLTPGGAGEGHGVYLLSSPQGGAPDP